MSLVRIFQLLYMGHALKDLPVLDIWTTIHYFFVIVCLFAIPKASGWAHVTWSWVLAARKKQTNPKRCSYGCSTLISDVVVKNMGDCGNSNEKLTFLYIANSRSKMKNTVF